MSPRDDLADGPANPMEPSVVAFDVNPVEHDVGVRDRERAIGDVRWALVEYAPGARRDGWCTQPHMGYLIAGELEYVFEDGRTPLRLRAGNGFILPALPGHAGRNHGSEPARLFIIDALATGPPT